nr:MAG TPA: hypothetical protein [Caudoviricetes sp.]
MFHVEHVIMFHVEHVIMFHVKHPQNRIPPARRLRLRNNVELPTHSSIY